MFSERSDWNPWSMTLLVIKVCQAHSHGHHNLLYGSSDVFNIKIYITWIMMSEIRLNSTSTNFSDRTIS